MTVLRPSRWPRSRRVAAAAAVVAVAAAVAVFAAPAASGPPPRQLAPGLCTTQELADMGNWGRCLEAMRNDLVDKATCVQAPTPDDPTGGIAGRVVERPDADLRSGITGRFTQYGVAGYQLPVYDRGCAAGIVHASDSTASDVGSLGFGLAALIVGVESRVRDAAYQPGSVWGFMDGWIVDTTNTVADYIWKPAGALAFVIVGLLLAWKSRTGDLSRAMKTVGWSIMAAGLLTAVIAWPATITHGTDRAGAAVLEATHQAIGPQSATIPADQCHNLDPAACVDHRPASVRTSDVFVDTILYRNWLTALLGNPDSETAKAYGPMLYDASTFSWGEAADMQGHPESRAAIIARKAEQWNTVAATIKKHDPVAYDYLQGKHGQDRFFAGGFAVFSATAAGAFDLFANIMILFGFLIVRWTLLLLPVVGVIGIVEPASGMLRFTINWFVRALVWVALYGFSSALYVAAVVGLFTSDAPWFVQLLAAPLMGLVAWLLTRYTGKVRVLGKAGTFRDHDDDPGQGRQAGRLRNALRDVLTTTGGDYRPPPAVPAQPQPAPSRAVVRR